MKLSFRLLLCLIAAMCLCSVSRAAQTCNAPCRQFSNSSNHGAIKISSLSATLKAVATGDTIIVPVNWGPGNTSAPNCTSVKVTDNASGGSNTYVVDKTTYPIYWPNHTYPFCFAQLHTVGGVHGSPTVITATVSPTATQEINVTALDFAGISTSGNPVDVSVTQQQTSANDLGYTDSPSLTTATNGEILVESMGFSAGTPGPPLSGWNTCDPSITTMCNWRVATSAGTYRASYGANGDQQWVTILTAYRTSGSGTTASPSITATPSSLNFGSVTVGSSSTQTLTIENKGASQLTLGPLTLLGTGFEVTDLPSSLLMGANTSLSIKVVFSPTSVGTYSGSLPLLVNGATLDSVPLGGTGIAATSNPGTSSGSSSGTSSKVTVTPSSLSFGNVSAGSSKTLTLQIKNASGAAMQLSHVSVSGSGFSLSNTPSDLFMAVNTYLTFSVVFKPTSAGTYSGSLPFVVNGVTVDSVPLIGAGTGSSSGSSSGSSTPPATSSKITVTPSPVSFGSVAVGASKSQTLTIKNVSGARMQLTSLSISGSGFKLAGVPSDLLMAANTYLTFSVVFTPSSAATYSGSLAVTGNGVKLASISLSGAGSSSSQ